MERMVLNPLVLSKYRLTLKSLDGDGYTIETEEADAYVIHASGFHIFVVRGRIVRSLVSWRVVEVRQMEEG